VGSVFKPSGELERGDLVRLGGLRSNPELNGHLAKLLRYSVSRHRWEVALEGQAGVKALRLENLECVSDAGDKIFPSWRSQEDLGGPWQAAEVGLCLRLEKADDVSTDDVQALKCSFNVQHTARLVGLLNPQEFAERTEYLQAVVAPCVDDDTAVDLKQDEMDLMHTLTNVLKLHASSIEKKVAEKIPMLRLKLKQDTAIEKLSASRQDFWLLAAFWRSFSHRRLQLDKLEKIFHSSVDAYSEAQGKAISREAIKSFLATLQKDVAATARWSFFEQKMLHRMLPLQNLIQARTHRERLLLLREAMEDEHERLAQEGEPVECSDTEFFSHESEVASKSKL
jgi:hypothetical protein